MTANGAPEWTDRSRGASRRRLGEVVATGGLEPPTPAL